MVLNKTRRGGQKQNYRALWALVRNLWEDKENFNQEVDVNLISFNQHNSENADTSLSDES